MGLINIYMKTETVEACYEKIKQLEETGVFKNKLEARTGFINLLKRHALFKQDDYKKYDEFFEIYHDEVDEFLDPDEEIARVEFANSQDSLYLYLDDGWTEDFHIELIGSKRHNKFISMFPYDDELVIEDLQKSALQILGRVNNPKSWKELEDSSFEDWRLSNGNFAKNSKGLVYGMVQSGKTASMLMLTDLALSAGFNFIIHLSSDKESLRDQTQDRINKLFSVGTFESKSHKFITPTAQQDYIQAFNKEESILVKYGQLLSNPYVICIKKQKDNLSALLHDLKALRENSKSQFGVEYEDLIRCMIIDDEADYASQNNKKYDQSKINELLTEIRKAIIKNDYVGYTATPQACFGADKNSIVGYPSDFVYPISPLIDNGRHKTYCGHLEFFQSKDSKHVVKLLNDDCWIHWSKQEGKSIIYIPESEKAQKHFKSHEKDFLKRIEEEGTSSKTAIAFKEALKDYLVATSVRWFRHADNEGVNHSNLKEKITEVNALNSHLTKSGHKEFPHTAMMFNAVLENENQEKIKNLLKLCIGEFLSEISQAKSILHFFDSSLDRQWEKSRNMDCPMPDKEGLSSFLQAAVDIVLKDKSSVNSDVVYLLNSSDEGQNLKYDTYSNLRPKRAAIFIGGHMLGRGITLEGLMTSVFLRSQNASMMDTNLQMCRWFGHKRSYFDLCSLYIQRHNLNLFSDISEADVKSRKALRDELLEGKSGHELLNVLFSSTLFRLTSPNKSRHSIIISNDLYGSKSISLRGTKVGSDWKSRPTRFLTQLNSLINQRDLAVRDAHNRAFVVPKVTLSDLEEFQKLWPQDSLNGEKFREIRAYIEASIQAGDSDKITIAVFGASFNKVNREFILGGLEPSSGINQDGMVNMPRRSFNILKGSVNALYGGSSESGYGGDKFIDVSDHEEIKSLSSRRKSDGVLIVFYLLNAQYLNKNEASRLDEADEGYSDKGMLGAVVFTPPSNIKDKVTINTKNLH